MATVALGLSLGAPSKVSQGRKRQAINYAIIPGIGIQVLVEVDKQFATAYYIFSVKNMLG